MINNAKNIQNTQSSSVLTPNSNSSTANAEPIALNPSGANQKQFNNPKAPKKRIDDDTKLTKNPDGTPLHANFPPQSEGGIFARKTAQAPKNFSPTGTFSRALLDRVNTEILGAESKAYQELPDTLKDEADAPVGKDVSNKLRELEEGVSEDDSIETTYTPSQKRRDAEAKLERFVNQQRAKYPPTSYVSREEMPDVSSAYPGQSVDQVPLVHAGPRKISKNRSVSSVAGTTLEKPYTEIAKLAQEPDLTIVLDFDGTVSEFVPNPLDARPVSGIIDTAQALAALQGTTIAFVSGRPLNTLEQLTGLQYDGDVQLIGSHGSEYIPGKIDMTPSEQAHLAEMKEVLPKMFNDAVYPNIFVETEKPMGVGVNTREVSKEHENEVIKKMRNLVEEKWPGAKITEGNGVVELSFGKDKGYALQKLRNTGPVIFCGDDTTDEDAFKIMQDRDLSIKVLNVKNGALDSRPTAAKTQVEGPQEMRTVLQNLLEQRTAHFANLSTNNAEI